MYLSFPQTNNRTYIEIKAPAKFEMLTCLQGMPSFLSLRVRVTSNLWKSPISDSSFAEWVSTPFPIPFRNSGIPTLTAKAPITLSNPNFSFLKDYETHVVVITKRRTKKRLFFFFNGQSTFHFGHLTTIPQLNQLYFNDLIAPSLYTRDVPESQ